VSIQDVRQNPQDTSNFYLSNIYRTILEPNISSSLPASPPPFSPPTYAILVNTLWFLSLVISLTCALLATLLQQWARRYLKVTQTRYRPHKRARIRAFFAEGVENCFLPLAVEALPTLLHISLSLFFAGSVVFLWHVNLTIFKFVLSWVSICTALYGCITFIPIFRHDSPYLTPLSFLAWYIVTAIPFLTFRGLRGLTYLDCFSNDIYDHFRALEERYRNLLMWGMQKAAEQTALNSPSEIDTRAFLWTFDRLDEGHDLERFFSGLPSFRSSEVGNPLPSLTLEQKEALSTALTGLFDRTFSSDLCPSVKNRRAIICAKAVDPAHIPDAFSVLDIMLSKCQDTGPLATDIVRIVTGWGNYVDQDATLDAQATIFMIVARVQPRDDAWFILASKALGIPEAVLRDYATHGENLSLAILIHVVRHQFSHFWKMYRSNVRFYRVLEAASKFKVHDTLPELRHDFCELWNQIVREVQNKDDQTMAFYILGRIRNVFLSLHQQTGSAPPTRLSPFTGDQDDILYDPFLYPLCNVPGNHPNSTAHIHDDDVFIPHGPSNTAPILASSPDTPTVSAHASIRVDETLTTTPLLDKNMSLPVSLQRVHQTTPETDRIPSTASSLNPIPTLATHGRVGSSARSMRIAPPGPSAPASSLTPEALPSLPDPIAVEHIVVSHAASDVVDAASTPLGPGLDDMHIGLLLSLDSPVTGSDHPSSPEPHASMVAPAAPGPSRPRLSSYLDPAVAVEEEGRPKAVL
jgi:hypothetical protein